MSNNTPFDKEPADFSKPESKYANSRKNKNKINDSIVEFFSDILSSRWFHRITLTALSLVVFLFSGLIISLIYFVFRESKEMIGEVLSILFKTATPCTLFFVFFIKFGEHKIQ